MARIARPEPIPKTATRDGAPEKGTPAKESYRETVEAVAIAFILALLVRGFEAEAFVIPTGSMAPTLMGRHKEITCPQCGYLYTVNASEEVEGVENANQAAERRVAAGVCVNCRFQAPLAAEPSFKGDRILVMKFPYEFPWLPAAGGPDRWDVVVFRYPEEPETSYIKRLVGLPGETVRIWYGDVFIKRPDATDFALERRPPHHQQAMQMMVHDDRHRPSLLKDRAEWKRWVAQGAGEGGWVEDSFSGGTFRLEPDSEDWRELRYRHVVPDPEQWRALLTGIPLARQPRPMLITDFYSYNTNASAYQVGPPGTPSREPENSWLQPHWVGDLTLSCRVESESAGGSLRFELVEGGVINRCEVDLASGEAVFSHGSTEIGRGATGLRGSGSHEVTFANVDNRLTLWVDGRPVLGDGFVYEDPVEAHPEPTNEDLAPARVSGRGGRVAVSGLVLKRDIYYTQTPGYLDYGSSWDTRLPRNPVELFEWLAEPRKVASLGPLNWTDYPLGADRFLMLGDNSPRSKDSRGWRNDDSAWDTLNRQRWEVPRSMITGKAFCVYWPHGKPFGPNIQVNPDFRVPFRPYFERMSWIH